MIYFKLVLMALFWGGTFIAGRTLSIETDPITAGFMRFFLASVFLGLILLHVEKGLPKITKRDLVAVCCLGLSGVFCYNAFFFAGLQTVEAGRAGLIIALNPIVTFIVVQTIKRVIPHPLAVLGVAASLMGAWVVLSDGQLHQALSGAIGQGEIYLMACVACWVCYAVIGRGVMVRLSPLVSTTYAVWAGTLMLSVALVVAGNAQDIYRLSSSAWLSACYLAFFGTTIGFIWFYQGIKTIGAERASVFVNFVPVFAIWLGALMLGEAVTHALIIGGIFIICGVVLTNHYTDKPFMRRRLSSAQLAHEAAGR